MDLSRRHCRKMHAFTYTHAYSKHFVERAIFLLSVSSCCWLFKLSNLPGLLKISHGLGSPLPPLLAPLSPTQPKMTQPESCLGLQELQPQLREILFPLPPSLSSSLTPLPLFLPLSLFPLPQQQEDFFLDGGWKEKLCCLKFAIVT